MQLIALFIDSGCQVLTTLFMATKMLHLTIHTIKKKWHINDGYSIEVAMNINVLHDIHTLTKFIDLITCNVCSVTFISKLVVKYTYSLTLTLYS